MISTAGGSQGPSAFSASNQKISHESSTEGTLRYDQGSVTVFADSHHTQL